MATAIERAAHARARSQALVHLLQRGRLDLGRTSGGVVRMETLQSRLAAGESRFRALVAVAGHVTWTTDGRGAMLRPQAAWRGYTAQSSAESLAAGGFGWLNALHPDDRDAFWQRCQQAMARGELFEAQARMRRMRSGRFEWRDNIVRLVPVRDRDGATYEWVGANIDVTEFVHARDAAEREVRIAREDAERARDTAERARAIAEAATAVKGRVLAAASHDIRSPLAAIAGYAAVLESGALGELNEAQKGVLERMANAQKHLLTLVTDILRAAEAGSGEVQLDIADVELEEVCEALTSLVTPIAVGKGVALRCDLPAGHGSRITAHADRERVLQILINLATNAIKFTEPGGAVTVDATVDADWTLVRVTDTGCGIPRNEHDTIFMPFLQVERRQAIGSAADRGVGLGLATSRDLARRMGGDITVASEVGAGSVFTVRLPSALQPANGSETPVMDPSTRCDGAQIALIGERLTHGA